MVDFTKTAKEFLEELRIERRTLAMELEMIRRLEADSVSITAAINPDRVSGSHDPHKQEDRLIKLSDAAAMLLSRKDDYEKRRAHALRIIMTMDDVRYRLVIGNRYLLGMEWPEVASSIGYEERQMYRVHGCALKEFGLRFGGNMSVDVSECQ